MTAAPQSIQPSITDATPTPWRVFTTPDGRKLVGIGSQDGEGILDCGFGVWSWMHADGIANANLVVEAVNSHASLKARVEELEATLKWIEARDRMWTAPEYEKGNEVLERGPHNIKIRGSYGAAANLVLKRAAPSQSSAVARTEQERGK